MPVIYKNKQECTGCTACMNRCPRNAITMQPDECGFLYPSISALDCIECGVCVQVHEQVISKGAEKDPLCAYAVKFADSGLSASGGVSAALAKDCLDHGGVVYGAAFTGDFKAKHIRISSGNYEINKIKGSKYVQSDLNDIFLFVKHDLEAGQRVMFTGTPCQIKGLKTYLGKEYEKLLTVDIVCHGVPSQKMLDDFVKTLKNTGHKSWSLWSLSFRDKKIGWGLNGSATYMVYGEDEAADLRKKKLWGSANPYFYYFNRGDIYRDSCYECQFTDIHNRPGDITLCDYWGIEKQHPSFDTEGGVSGVICNTPKGAEAIAVILPGSTYIETTAEKIANGNTQLIRPSIKPDPSVLETYKEEGWEGIEKKYSQLPWAERHKSQVKAAIPAKLKETYKKHR